MNTEIEKRLIRLAAKFNAALDQIHDEALAKFRKLAKSTGQRTRTDRGGRAMSHNGRIRP